MRTIFVRAADVSTPRAVPAPAPAAPSAVPFDEGHGLRPGVADR